ncbi:hypothetical protein HY491_03910 [Candidatus Woesearchaeota archaeon]|nr:hypothetical protein [Candidatus Woesearchaeota archaeon]
MSNLNAYFQRILPVVGRALFGKKLFFGDLHLTAMVVDAFARCGVSSFVLADDRKVVAGDVIARMFGNHYADQSAAAALADALQRHNSCQSGWTFTRGGQGIAAGRPDIVISGINQQLMRACAAAKVPGVFFSLLQSVSVNGIVLLVHPDLPFPELESAGWLPQEQDLHSMLDSAELSDIAAAIASAFLLRGTKHQRKGIESFIFSAKRNVIVRGTKVWPWDVNFLDSTKHGETLLAALRPVYRSSLPVELVAGRRIMLIGCGTGSLFAWQAVNYVHNMLLVDCKPFSGFNPVRQFCSTDDARRLELKPVVLGKKLARLVGGIVRCTHYDVAGMRLQQFAVGQHVITAAGLEVTEGTKEQFAMLVSWYNPDAVIVAMGRTEGENFVACKVLRHMGIRHIIPSAFPSATHYKHVVVDGSTGLCYDCVQSKTRVDAGAAPNLSSEQAEMFYGGTQPATIFETWPSSHSLMRLCIELLLPDAARSAWFWRLLHNETPVLVGGNLAQQQDGFWLYGVPKPFAMVVFGKDDIIGINEKDTCATCGRVNQVMHRIT